MATRTVSVDEYLDARKRFVDKAGRLHKGTVAEKARAPASFDKEKGTCRFTMSAEIEDRDNDIVMQGGLDMVEFLKNPVAPFAHDSADFPIGNWSDVEQLLTGRPKRTEGTLNLLKGDPVADRLALHLGGGTIKACSIGFMPLAIERRPTDDNSMSWPGYIIHEAELYECSPCCIPANPAALAKSAAANGLLPREVIEQVLDAWTLKDGLLVSRDDYEAEQRRLTGERTTVVIDGRKFRQIQASEDGSAITLERVPDTAAEVLTSQLEAGTPESRTLLQRIGKLLGIPAAPTAAEKAAADAAAQVAAAEADEAAAAELEDTDARVAALDVELGLHAPS